MRILIVSTALAALTLGAVAQAAPGGVGLGRQFPQACASGYHPDAGGNCQPDAAQSNRFCPNGTVFQPTFDGWTCNPPPPEAY